MNGNQAIAPALLTGHSFDLLPRAIKGDGARSTANFDTEKVLERSLGISKQSTIVVFTNGKEACGQLAIRSTTA